MKLILYSLALAVFASQAQAAQCPSPKVVLKAINAGFIRFDRKGNSVVRDEVGQIRSTTIMGLLDKASPKVSSQKFRPIKSGWRAPAGMGSAPNWRLNITLKRGIFGDGEVTFTGSSIAYGGQLSCSYDFSEASGLNLNAVAVSGTGAACLPAKAKGWKLMIPANKSGKSIAAQCAGSTAASCSLACISYP